MSLDTPYIRGAEKLAQRIRTIRENTGVTLGSGVLLKALRDANLRRFDKEVSPTGGRWPVRAHDRSGRTDRRGAGKGTLVRTGALRASIDVIRGRSAGLLAVSTGAGGRIGVTTAEQSRYGRFHQFGIGVPKRTFLGIAASDIVMIDSALRRAIIRQSGLR